LCEPCRTAFASVKSGLESAGIPFTINPRLVRGLDYYTRTVFELWHENLGGAQNSLGGGGRYDGLAEELGYKSTPAIGFALGLERTASILKQHRPGPDVVVIAIPGVEEEKLVRLAARLYDHGLSVVVDRSSAKLDAKLRAAAKHLARTCVIFGPEESSRGEAVVRDMERKSQRSVVLESVPEAILQDLAG
jgi:histidyl-tRNA synthetase